MMKLCCWSWPVVDGFLLRQLASNAQITVLPNFIDIENKDKQAQCLFYDFDVRQPFLHFQKLNGLYGVQIS